MHFYLLCRERSVVAWCNGCFIYQSDIKSWHFLCILNVSITDYGVGYAWDKDPHTISVGDYVTWTWETPSYVSDIAYGVHQTDRADSLSNKNGGFTSGTNTRRGEVANVIAIFSVKKGQTYWRMWNSIDQFGKLIWWTSHILFLDQNFTISDPHSS